MVSVLFHTLTEMFFILKIVIPENPHSALHGIPVLYTSVLACDNIDFL